MLAAASPHTDFWAVGLAIVSALASILYLLEFVGHFAIARWKKRSARPAKRFLGWRRLAVISGAAVPIASFFVPRTAALVLVALVFAAVMANEYLSWRGDQTAPAVPVGSASFVSSLPIKTIEEAVELAERCAATSKDIYAFLTKTATRTDDAKVLAEYRQKFEAKVSGLYTDLLGGGLSPDDRLAGPVFSRADIHWAAFTLGSRGESYSAERLEKLRQRAMTELGFDHSDLEATQERLDELKELEPFMKEDPPLGSDPLTALEQWMEREVVPESTRSRMRATLEGLLKEMKDKGLRS